MIRAGPLALRVGLFVVGGVANQRFLGWSRAGLRGWVSLVFRQIRSAAVVTGKQSELVGVWVEARWKVLTRRLEIRH